MPTPPLLRVVEREARVYKRLWRGIAFTMFVQPTLYLAAMGLGLGGLVNSHTGSVAGLDYLDFVAPGLLVAGVMQLACTESLWPVLGGVRMSTGTVLDEIVGRARSLGLSVELVVVDGIFAVIYFVLDI